MKKTLLNKDKPTNFLTYAVVIVAFVIMQTLSKNDKKRASYYNYYTENRWGEAKNYDLCLNTQMGNEVCADLIVRAAQAMMEGAK